MSDRRWVLALVLFMIWSQTRLSAQETIPWHDPSSHTIQFVAVDDNVKLEVLDWGGTGRPLVFLAGLGNTAHVFDDFAPKLAPQYHVYGITRRGFGSSSVPASGYSADRLGDDVLAVLDLLKVNRPILVGHSIAGEELSSIGSRHPERVAGLIYLDAAYDYAYYDPSIGNVDIDTEDLQKKIEQLRTADASDTQKQLLQDLLQRDIPNFARDLREEQTEIEAQPTIPPPTAADRESFQAWASWRKRIFGVAFPEAESRQQREVTAEGHVGEPRTKPVVRHAIEAGEQKYSEIHVPLLAVYAIPPDYGPYIDANPVMRQTVEAANNPWHESRAAAFEAAVPSARVVRIPHANHYVFLSNEDDVLREMRAFLQGLL